MWSRIFAAVLASATSVAACAPAMSAPQAPPCRVVNGEKLPPESGGAEAICAAIEQAVSARAPAVRYSAEVRVISKSALSARIVADGRTLPEQHLSVSDRYLNPLSIKHFAEALAEEVVKASKA
jgi:hypothetical protein